MDRMFKDFDFHTIFDADVCNPQELITEMKNAKNKQSFAQTILKRH